MKLVASTDDQSYFERRAQILIEEARAGRFAEEGVIVYEERIVKAIQLLVLAALQ